jgi:phenylalanyl-tRNA synthetase alpha chain
VYPQCPFDISFWLPDNGEFNSNDFFDLVREVGGDLVEQVKLIDEFENTKKKKKSHCYKIVYRSPDKTMTTEEANAVHKRIEAKAVELLGVTIR